MPPRRRALLDTWVAALWEERLTRRAFVQRSLACGTAAALVRDIVRLHTAEAATKEAATNAKPTPQVLAQIKKEGNKLFIYNWEDYLHPHTLPRFEKEFGVKVTYDTFTGNEQLLAKIQAGGAKYDVIFPTHNFVPVYIAQGLLAPLHHELLPNLSHIIPTLRDTPFDPGNKYTVPYGWGMTGLAYLTTQVKEEPQRGSWALLFEHGAQRYGGKLGLTDEREEVVAAALQYLKYAPNTHDKDALRQAGEVLLKLKPHVKALYPGVEMRKALITEDIVVAQCWSGEAVKAQAKNAAVAWEVPTEGGTGWFDVMAIPKAAPHQFTAEVFLNFMLQPDVAADNANTTGYATANGTAVEKYVAPEVAKNPAIYPPAEALSRLTFLATLPDDLLPIYEDIWSRFLAT